MKDWLGGNEGGRRRNRKRWQCVTVEQKVKEKDTEKNGGRESESKS